MNRQLATALLQALRVVVLGPDSDRDGGSRHSDREPSESSPSPRDRAGVATDTNPLRNFRKPPPDPDGMNDRRAAWAGAAIRAFMNETGTDEEDALGDLLADLIHWADRHGYDMDLALERARGHYEAETGGDGAE